MTKGFWFNFLKNLTLGTTALVVLIIVLNNFFHVPVFQSLKPQVAKAAEVSPGAACCRAGIENNLCSPGTGNEWKYFSTQSECDTWAQTLNTYGYTCNPGEGTVGGSCTQDGDGSIRCRGGISQSVVNPSFCGTPPPPAPTVKYRCDTNNYACVRDDTNGAYTSISACDTACTRPVTQKFRCDTNTYACIRDDINGNYTDAASCIAGCVRPAVPKYRCDTNTYACVRDDVNGAYTDNYACSTACQRSNVPTCQLSASVNGMNATLTTTPSISAYSISRYLFYFGIGS